MSAALLQRFAHTVELAERCAEMGGPALVIGATGFSSEQDAAIEKTAERIAIVKSGNFSLGVNMLIAILLRNNQRKP